MDTVWCKSAQSTNLLSSKTAEFCHFEGQKWPLSRYFLEFLYFPISKFCPTWAIQMAF